VPVVAFTFGRGGLPLQMKLDLEEARPNERSILRALQAGIFFEPDVANLLVRVISEGDVVLDVGANIGFFTVFSSILVGEKGRVVAFEPGADNLARLRANLAYNDCKNVTLVEKAVTNRIGEAEFFINSDDSGGNALWDPGQFPGNVKSLANPMPVVVPATTLDAEWHRLQLPAPKAIKIDTEGAEQQVLEGARDLLVRHKPRFVIAELHSFGLEKLGCSERSLREFMENLGYSTFALAYAGTLPHLVPRATRIEALAGVNILFSTPEWVGASWPSTVVDPRTRK
jgi:FkbM family methyltransferase